MVAQPGLGMPSSPEIPAPLLLLPGNPALKGSSFLSSSRGGEPTGRGKTAKEPREVSLEGVS